MINLLLAIIIKIFHIFIISFELLLPFCNIPEFLLLHIIFTLGLMLHWITNSNICCLTILEAYLRNINLNNTITSKFISPIYLISDYYYSHIIWIITIILLLISCYKLYNVNNLYDIIKKLLRKSNLYFN